MAEGRCYQVIEAIHHINFNLSMSCTCNGARSGIYEDKYSCCMNMQCNAYVKLVCNNIENMFVVSINVMNITCYISGKIVPKMTNPSSILMYHPAHSHFLLQNFTVNVAFCLVLIIMFITLCSVRVVSINAICMKCCQFCII